MRGIFAYLAPGALISATLSLFSPPIGYGLAVHAWSAMPAADAAQAVQYVDRSHKGDRLDNVTTIMRQPAPLPAFIPFGCDPLFSFLSQSPGDNRPGSCAV